MRCTSPIPDALRQEIDAFNCLDEELVCDHQGKYVLIKDGQPHGFFGSFTDAHEEAKRKFGASIYLIRLIPLSE
jgi:hypothetical protein